MNKTYDRRLIFVGAWLTIFLVAANSTFSVLSKNVAQQRHLNLADITLAYPINLLLFAAFGIIAGIYADKCDCRALVLIGAPLCGLAWILTGMSKTTLQFFISFGMTGLGEGILYSPLLTSTLRWFPDGRGRASGILLSAAALGPFMMAPLFNMGFLSIGVEAALRYFGLVVIVIPMLFAFTHVKPPKDYENKLNIKVAVLKQGRKDYTPFEMLKNPRFYFMILIFMVAVTAGNMMIGLLYTIAMVQIKLSATAAAFAVSICTVSNCIGRLAFGLVYDKFGGIRSLLLSLSITIISLFFISMTGNGLIIGFYILVALIGFAAGGPMVIFPTLTANVFGEKYLGINYGIMFFGYALSGFTGPRIGTFVYNRTGEFIYGYYISIALTIIGVFMILFLNKLFKQNRESKNDASDIQITNN